MSKPGIKISVYTNDEDDRVSVSIDDNGMATADWPSSDKPPMKVLLKMAAYAGAMAVHAGITTLEALAMPGDL